MTLARRGILTGLLSVLAGCSPAALLNTTVSRKGYTLEAGLPFAALGFTPQQGQSVRFDLAVDDSSDGESRRCQIVWNGTERDSVDRTGWGTAVFGQ